MGRNGLSFDDEYEWEYAKRRPEQCFDSPQEILILPISDEGKLEMLDQWEKNLKPMTYRGKTSGEQIYAEEVQAMIAQLQLLRRQLERRRTA